MKVSFNGLLETVTTFETSGTVEAGNLVIMNSNGTVETAVAGNAPVGIAVDVESDGCASVQIRGYAELEYSGTAPTIGYQSIVVGTSGSKIALEGANQFGVKVLVVSVDTTNKIAGIIL